MHLCSSTPCVCDATKKFKRQKKSVCGRPFPNAPHHPLISSAHVRGTAVRWQHALAAVAATPLDATRPHPPHKTADKFH